METIRKINAKESDLILSKINLKTLDVQISSRNRPFRASGLKQLGIGKYINGVQKFCWEYSFLFLDVPEEFFKIRIGYNDEVTELIKSKT